VARDVFLATDAARLMKENGFPAPDVSMKKVTIMKKEFDPAKPEDYLKSFAIKRS
jgi:nitrate/nitrite transport system substrate-binding protein